MNEKKQTLTIAVFSKNEDVTIKDVIDGILRHYEAKNIVVVVYEITEYISGLSLEKGISLLQDNGRGKGAAIRKVIEQAQSDILVFVDADGSHNTDDIPRLVQPLMDDKADMVIASRLKGGSEEFSGDLESYIHLAGNYVSSLIITLFWGERKWAFIDTQNGFRAVRSAVAKDLKLEEEGFAIEQEMVIKCLKKKYRIFEIPSYEYKRKHGKSHIDFTKSLFHYVWSIIRQIFVR
jgi:dolichol-phosphate mannosyltransferase